MGDKKKGVRPPAPRAEGEGLVTQPEGLYTSLIDSSRRVTWDIRQQERMILRMNKLEQAERDARGNIPWGALDKAAASYERDAMEATNSMDRQIAFTNARVIREHMATVKAWQDAIRQIQGVYQAGTIAEYLGSFIF